jgi:hypothetical protein
MVDKNFAFCPVKQDGGTKKIQDQSGIPTNMTLISAHFKISTNKGRNPFKKQKMWKNNKEGKGDLKTPSSTPPWQLPLTRNRRISWRGSVMNGIGMGASC